MIQRGTCKNRGTGFSCQLNFAFCPSYAIACLTAVCPKVSLSELAQFNGPSTDSVRHQESVSFKYLYIVLVPNYLRSWITVDNTINIGRYLSFLIDMPALVHLNFWCIFYSYS